MNVPPADKTDIHLTSYASPAHSISILTYKSISILQVQTKSSDKLRLISNPSQDELRGIFPRT